MRLPSTCALLLLMSFPLCASESGTKMTVRITTDHESIEHTVYRQSDRKRMEYRNSDGYRLGPHLASITRCDLGRMFELNLDSSQYVSAPYPPKPFTKEEIRRRGLDHPVQWSEKPLIRIETKTVDTGERKQMFGHTARHVIITRTETPLEGSHSQPEESVRDGWYIDLEQQISCDPEYMRNSQGRSYSYVLATIDFGHSSQKQVMDKPEFVTIGTPETGFALEEKNTSDYAYKSPAGTLKDVKSDFKTVVTELQEGPLDPSLFEVPRGFKQVKEIERNPPMTSNPVMEFWEWTKYKVANWFGID